MTTQGWRHKEKLARYFSLKFPPKLFCYRIEFQSTLVRHLFSSKFYSLMQNNIGGNIGDVLNIYRLPTKLGEGKYSQVFIWGGSVSLVPCSFGVGGLVWYIWSKVPWARVGMSGRYIWGGYVWGVGSPPPTDTCWYKVGKRAVRILQGMHSCVACEQTFTLKNGVQP